MVAERCRRASEASRRRISRGRNNLLPIMVGLVPTIRAFTSLIA
jgi:hypothetical protein